MRISRYIRENREYFYMHFLYRRFNSENQNATSKKKKKTSTPLIKKEIHGASANPFASVRHLVETS